MSTSVATVMQMLEALPQPMQDKIAEHLREYILELQDDAKWDESFLRTDSKLATAAQIAKEQIAAGESSPMDFSEL